MIAMKRLRRLLRTASYRSGALSLARTRLRRALTVVMLHRVMDPADPDFAQADPEFTLSTPLFDQLLGFFVRHYAVVSLDDVMRAREGVRKLPDHALLITFDDGWADNFRYAAPLLKERGLPAVVFAAAEPILSTSKAWWQEQVFAAARAGLLDDWLAKHADRGRLAMTGNNSAGALALVVRLGRMAEEERSAMLADLPAAPCQARMMLEPKELPQLAEYGIALGIHGFTHLPLTEIADVEGELGRARAAIAAISEGTAVTEALALPHSRYNDAVIAAASAAGIKHIFTGDPHLERTSGGMLPIRPTLCRIHINGDYIARGRDRLDPAAAARWLWDRQSV